MPDPVLSVRGAVKTFGTTRALAGVDFDVRRGEIHALMGENGAGKSTLIRVMTGAHAADGGTMTLDGRTFAPRSPAEAEAAGVVCVHQEVRLPGRLTTSDVLSVGREKSAFSFLRRGAEISHARRVLSLVGLDVDPRTPLGLLPLAARQLVAIARALAVEARLLVLDEPTASLDATEVDRLFALLRGLRDRGMGIVFVSHVLDQLYSLCDVVTVLRDGVRTGTSPLSGLPRSALVELMIGRPPPPDLRERRPPSDAAKAAPPALTAVDLGQSGVISPFTLELRPGETLGLAGLLGSGRTEVARLLAGLARPDCGVLRLLGRVVRFATPRDAVRAGIGFVPEDRKAEGLAIGLSVRDNLMLAMQASRGLWRRIPSSEQRRLADEMIVRLRIKCADADASVGSLSGGNQQKVVLASRLLLRPRILVLDEPTRGVDVGARAEIEACVDGLRDDGAAICLVAAEIEHLLRASDRLAVLRDHAVVARFDAGPDADLSIRSAVAGGPGV